MKIRFFIYGIILVVGIVLFSIFVYPSKSFEIAKIVAPTFACNLKSGEAPAVTFDKTTVCSAGCMATDVQHIKELNCFDCDSYTYRCIPE